MSTYTPIRDQLAQLKTFAESQSKEAGSRFGADRLVNEINAWLDTMSQQQSRKFTIDEVVTLAKLTGKYHSDPAKRDVAQALRVLGFRPCRDWSVTGRNRRYWIKCYLTM
jgi:primosomal protein N''